MKKSFLTFLLMLFCLAGFAQQTVTGVILEEATSEPLAGAAVQVKDSQNGTIADADGRFSISVSPGQTLLISYIGLIPQEILIKEGMKDLTIKMLSDAVDINEVVVVGY
ncbi:MAG TPA: SusC/RagA family TonB-linked outer membrane protein, partial [Parabacteroides goldsteinii]|nr:SusC/RagA family TonB-linked outer membrane protein [Parabacteroides goldsteinii]